MNGLNELADDEPPERGSRARRMKDGIIAASVGKRADELKSA